MTELVADGRLRSAGVSNFQPEHLERMEENLAIFDFELSDADVRAIDALDSRESGRTGPNPDAFDWIP